MAWTAPSVFELRPDGSTLNGMGFDAAFGGTDYSQQTAAQISVADGVTNGTTTVTSATANFTAALVGNGINIASDSLYQITAVTNSTTITVDRVTANGGAGRSMKVGGAGSISTHGFDPVFYGVDAGKKTWIRGTNASGAATAYNPTVTALTTTAGSTASIPTTYEGYSTTRGDGGRAEIANAAMNSFTVNGFNVVKNLYLNSAAAGWTGPVFIVSTGQNYFENIKSLNTPGAGGVAGQHQINSAGNVFRNCLFDGGSIASNADGILNDSGNGNTYIFCEFKNSGVAGTGAVWLTSGNGHNFEGCLFWNNRGTCLRTNGLVDGVVIRGCIFWSTLSDTAPHLGSAIEIIGADGLTGWIIQNSIFGNNAAYDVSHTFSDVSTSAGAKEWLKAAWECNWFLTNGTGRYFQLPSNPNDTSLTVDPFVSSSTGNFTLNSTAGGGALISSSPCVTSFIDGFNTANLIAGFYGTTPTSTSTASMRNLWRELTNQRDTAVIPDSVVDIYLDWGLAELNRRIHFHYTTASDITLVEGVQEYTMPVDAIEIVWIQYGSNRLLEKGSVEQWRRLGEDWRNEPEGEPRFWAHYGNQFVIRPKPSNLAVSAAPNLTVRRKDTPPSITTNGPEQLPTEAYRIVVLYGAYLWSSCYPDSVVAQQRAAALKNEFEAGVQAMTESYARRELAL